MSHFSSPVCVKVDKDELIVGDGGVDGGGVELDGARLGEGERDEEEQGQHLPLHAECQPLQHYFR